MENCKTCGGLIDESFEFCPKCGTRFERVAETEVLEPAASPLEADNAKPEALTSKSPRPKNLKRPLVLAGSLGLVALIVALAANTSIMPVDQIQTEDASLATSFPESALAKAKGEICQKYGGITGDLDLTKYEKRANQAEKARRGDARQAAKFTSKNSWVYDEDLAQSFRESLSRVDQDSMKKLLDDAYPDLPADWREYHLTYMTGELSKTALYTCTDISERVAETNRILGSYDTNRTLLASLAGSVPWYPKGYFEYPRDTNVAIKWVRQSCELGDSCWHMQITTRSGCPTNLYAEINILDSAGNVIDYSNDVVPVLNAGASAIMEFPTYNSRASSAELSEINCY